MADEKNPLATPSGPPAANQYDQAATLQAMREARARATTSPNVLDRQAPPANADMGQSMQGGSRQINPGKDLGYTAPPRTPSVGHEDSPL
jgi:hypothetical protein